MILRIDTDTPQETRLVGGCLAACARPGDVLLLQGELGAGKTELVKGVAAELGVPEAVPVTSPTYTLLNQYSARIPLYHFDLYRLVPGDTADLGMDEYLYGDGFSIVEWPDRLAGDTPDTHLSATVLVTGETSRRIEIRCLGERCSERLDQLCICLKKVLTVSVIPAKH